MGHETLAARNLRFLLSDRLTMGVVIKLTYCEAEWLALAVV
jgi:hypothetical protein